MGAHPQVVLTFARQIKKRWGFARLLESWYVQMFNPCAARKYGTYGFSRLLLGLLLTSLLTCVTALRSEPIQIGVMIHKSELQCRKFPWTKNLTIIKIRSASRPSIMPSMSQNFGCIILQKYSSHQKDQAAACFSPSTSQKKYRRKVKCPEFSQRSEPLRPVAPCKQSSCPLCKREHPRTSTRLKLPFHLFSP